jgi:hypothetical protein
MAITRHFKETIQARVQRDPECHTGLLKENIENLQAGGTETGKTILPTQSNNCSLSNPSRRGQHCCD